MNFARLKEIDDQLRPLADKHSVLHWPEIIELLDISRALLSKVEAEKWKQGIEDAEVTRAIVNLTKVTIGVLTHEDYKEIADLIARLHRGRHLPPDRASEPNIISFFDDAVEAEQILKDLARSDPTPGAHMDASHHAYAECMLRDLKSKLEKSINLPAINPSEIRSAALEECALIADTIGVKYDAGDRAGLIRKIGCQMVAAEIRALKHPPERPKDNLVPQSQENAVGEEK